MYYGNIITSDVANGIGCRTSLFVSGCKHHCKGCFNPETWDFEYGQPYTDQTQLFILETLNKPYIDGITILGGEPLDPDNQETVENLVETVKNLYPDKSIWIYTGYLFESLRKGRTPYIMNILRNTDVIVDGKFDELLADIRLSFCGSANQRVIDVPKSLDGIKIYTLFD